MLLLLVALFLTALAAGYGALAISGRAVRAPDWLAARVLGAVNEALPEGRITLGNLRLRVGPRGLPWAVVDNLGLFDASGAEVARLNRVSLQIRPEPLLRGQLRLGEARLSGAQMVLRRRVDGTFALSFGGARPSYSGTLPQLIDGLDAALTKAPLNAVARFEAIDLSVSLEDARSGRIWQITDGQLTLSRLFQGAADGAGRPGAAGRTKAAGESGGPADPAPEAAARLGSGLDISARFEVFNGTEDLAAVSLGLRSDFASSRLSLGTSFRNALSRDIALQSPVLSFLQVLDAPISGALRAEFSEAGALSDLAGTLEIAAGALRPDPATPPLRFSGAKSYFDYDPRARKLELSELRLNSDLGALSAAGQIYLRDFAGGWPQVLLAQLRLSDIRLERGGGLAAPVALAGGATDLRLHLSPFSIDIGQLMLEDAPGGRLVASGRIAAAPEGWSAAVDFGMDGIEARRVLAFWPPALVPNTRKWLDANMLSGRLHDLHGALRLAPGQPMRRLLGWKFSDAAIRYMRTLPALEGGAGYGLIEQDRMTLVLEEGRVPTALGGGLDVAGTSFSVPDLRQKPARADLRLKGAGPVQSALSILALKPFAVFRQSQYGPDLAEGRVAFSADVGFALKKRIPYEEIAFAVRGTLSDLHSEKLVPGRLLRAARMQIEADPGGVRISGPVHLGAVDADLTWEQKLSPGAAGNSLVSGQVTLGPEFLREFSIGLPEGSVSGQGRGRFSLRLARGRPPVFSLQSDLNSLTLRLDALGWRKPANRRGRLRVEGQLGARARIDLLEMEAPGLKAEGGRVTLRADGGLKLASFSRVRAGRWLDAPMRLIGQGPGKGIRIELPSGRIDIRETALGGGGGASGRGAGGVPIEARLDEVRISSTMALRAFSGSFDTGGGLSGNFTASLNGAAPLAGTLQVAPHGTRVLIASENGGAVLRAAGIVDYANGGKLELTLEPQQSPGNWLGDLRLRNTRVKKAPGLTELLSAISIVGLLDQLSGEGISFDDVRARFLITPKAVLLQQSSAVGPSLGVSLDGRYDLASGQMDMNGVISPIFFLNRIGEALSKRGEGLFGFTFRLRGTADAPKISVNPLSILTPGALRDIFRASPRANPAPGQ